MNYNHSFNKYFIRHPIAPIEPEKKKNSLNWETKRLAIVIPVLAEKDWLFATLESLAQNPISFIEQSIILLCVNDSLSEKNLNLENQDLLDTLRNKKLDIFQILKPGDSLFWIDATFTGHLLPSPGGVGHARKLGFDSLFAKIGPLHNIPFVSLDADTLVSKNYLESILTYFQSMDGDGGFTIPFQHRCLSSEISPIIAQYDHFLTQYKQGLSFAESPYAYYSLGSAMGTSSKNYLKVGGMKTHTGGEDFYFLQALRKLGPISEIKNTMVFPAARLSQRVPFGTGPRLQDLINGKPLRHYPAILFQRLKQVIQIVSLCRENQWISLPQQFNKQLPHESNLFFQQHKFDEVWNKIIKNCPAKDDARKEAFHQWFDAFKTLKFIHFLSDYYI